MTDPSTEGSEPIWRPDPARAEATQLRAFMREASGVAGVEFEDFHALHRWSIDEPGAFWSLVWDACRIIGDRGSPEDRPIVMGKRMMDARFFPEARLNFAENLLWRSDDAPALVFRNERGARRELSFATLRCEVARLQRALRDEGIGVGDRVAGYLPNLPETIIAMLATASLGATWSSCSPDFGSAGVIDRFEQIEPSVLFATDGYTYGGKHFDCLPRLPEILAGVPSIRRCIVVPYTDEAPALDSSPKLGVWSDFVGAAVEEDPSFTRVPFDQPLYIVFSSGTTGKPKCIVHGVGGSLLQHAKEHRLHVDLSGEDHLFYFTTCGWMMWNWLVSGLATGARLILYDGSPAHPDGHTLFELAERERVTIFGTSAKFIDALAKEGVRPAEHADLSSLRTLLSTGSPLAPEGFDYIQQHIGRDIQIASISGGTDILSCFVLGNPISPVYRGEIQGPGLGMQVEVFDDTGQRVVEETGELVCTAPFPSMPVGFWRDDDDVRYHAAYFERFESAGHDVWCHGDFTQETAHGGYVISGRSDAVLNPGGVRIGTAEIYRQVEAIPEVVEGLAVGQAWQDDVRVLLFVRLRDGAVLDDALTQRIRQRIRSNTTPRHVPARVVQVADIPRTRSGKITELAVREVVHGRPVKNIEALANPEALEHFRNRVELTE